mmetsp:Transcript_61259/g.126541  ORF Transcript_61259/g.126541 Transcript_61259/m.126541 type:complete len:423 (+) Transcript_61259:436-1704(+)
MNQEGHLDISSQKETVFPPGLLISLLQRGIMYSQIETDYSFFSSENRRSPVENFFFKKRGSGSVTWNESVKTKNLERKFTFLETIFTIQTCIWHPRRLCVFFCTKNSGIFSWSLNSAKSKENPRQFGLPVFLDKKNSIETKILAFDFNLPGTILAIGTFCGNMVFFTETGKFLKKIFLPLGPVFEIKWTENSRNIATMNLTGKVSVWSTWYSKTLLEFFPHSLFAASIFWSENKKITTFSKDYTFSFCDFEKKNVLVIKAHNGGINDMAVFRGGRILAFCSEDQLISIWCLDPEIRFSCFLIGHEKEISSAVFNPIKFSKNVGNLEKFLISGSLDCSVKIWKVSSEICLVTIKEYYPFFSLAIDFCGKKIWAGAPGKVLFFDISGSKKECLAFDSKFGIFTMNSNSMVSKFLGCIFKSIFHI